MNPRLIILALLILALATCEKPERDNPWDELATLTPDEWAPTNLTLDVNDLSSVTLTWQQSIEYIEGFRIDRRKETEEWQTDIASIEKNQNSYTDDAVDLPAAYTYRIYAFAGNNSSSHIEASLGLPLVSTDEIISISGNVASITGNITSDGGFAVTVRGVVWSTSINPTVDNNLGMTTDGTGIGSFTSNLIELLPETDYIARAYATNILGSQYGNLRAFTSLKEGDVLNPITGKTWMDRNLGASRVALGSTDEQAFGDLYQWGRGTDGHEKPNSGTTSTHSSSSSPGHSNFIRRSHFPYDWLYPQKENLWQGVNGINNPCPSGYRVPTDAEWDAERNSWSSDDASGAFNSPLKLPVAGIRGYSNGSLIKVGSSGFYWSTAVDGSKSRNLNFSNSTAGAGNEHRAYGFSVRCIKN